MHGARRTRILVLILAVFAAAPGLIRAAADRDLVWWVESWGSGGCASRDGGHRCDVPADELGRWTWRPVGIVGSYEGLGGRLTLFVSPDAVAPEVLENAAGHDWHGKGPGQHVEGIGYMVLDEAFLTHESGYVSEHFYAAEELCANGTYHLLVHQEPGAHASDLEVRFEGLGPVTTATRPYSEPVAGGGGCDPIVISWDRPTQGCAADEPLADDDDDDDDDDAWDDDTSGDDDDSAGDDDDSAGDDDDSAGDDDDSAGDDDDSAGDDDSS